MRCDLSTNDKRWIECVRVCGLKSNLNNWKNKHEYTHHQYHHHHANHRSIWKTETIPRNNILHYWLLEERRNSRKSQGTRNMNEMNTIRNYSSNLYENVIFNLDSVWTIAAILHFIGKTYSPHLIKVYKSAVISNVIDKCNQKSSLNHSEWLKFSKRSMA